MRRPTGPYCPPILRITAGKTPSPGNPHVPGALGNAAQALLGPHGPPGPSWAPPGPPIRRGSLWDPGSWGPMGPTFGGVSRTLWVPVRVPL